MTTSCSRLHRPILPVQLLTAPSVVAAFQCKARKDLNQTEFLSWLLDSHPMRRLPGQKHLYSNIGYIFLGRIIEVLSERTYEEFVRQEIFQPLNFSARIGRKQRNNRQDFEVLPA
ncbi:hypothetical protein Tcan_15520 [Toxocara canis]|uniref:Beta-lactamase-related domain-containing protein n=1 Tax=Toxocara canis TaxID=6265 RepID=A0A0B2W1E3_TOXCA|nr:hypothetical protein Tcan_15520 [Toxocara canis]